MLDCGGQGRPGKHRCARSECHRPTSNISMATSRSASWRRVSSQGSIRGADRSGCCGPGFVSTSHGAFGRRDVDLVAGRTARCALAALRSARPRNQNRGARHRQLPVFVVGARGFEPYEGFPEPSTIAGTWHASSRNPSEVRPPRVVSPLHGPGRPSRSRTTRTRSIVGGLRDRPTGCPFQWRGPQIPEMRARGRGMDSWLRVCDRSC